MTDEEWLNDEIAPGIEKAKQGRAKRSKEELAVVHAEWLKTRKLYSGDAALNEFRYACQAWFACMTRDEREVALGLAKSYALDVPFQPRVLPQ